MGGAGRAGPDSSDGALLRAGEDDSDPGGVRYPRDISINQRYLMYNINSDYLFIDAEDSAALQCVL